MEFGYPVENGKNLSKWLRIGTIMQATRYPEFQPYWLYLGPPVDDGFGESISRYRTHQGGDWLPMSRPPNDLWNQLVAKDMRSYLEHEVLSSTLRKIQEK